MIRLDIDLAGVLELRDELEPKVEAALKEAGRQLAVQSHAHLVEQVNEKLHSTRQKYIDALSFQEVDGNTWVINLDRKAMWIEEGMPEHEMIDDLLKSPKAKTAKDGSRYLVVPFQHNAPPTQQTKAATDLTETLKRELTKRKIPYGKIETDAAGRPKLGLLHSFDIKNKPLKTAEAPGMGKGPLGAVRQGPTGIPFLAGVRIYQKSVEGPGGKSSVKRGIMTFRVVSSKMKGTGRWVHPGLDAKHFFEETEQWALNQWQTLIAPQILERVSQSL